MNIVYVFFAPQKCIYFFRKTYISLDKHIEGMLSLVMRMRKQIKNLILATLMLIAFSGKGALVTVAYENSIQIPTTIERTI